MIITTGTQQQAEAGQRLELFESFKFSPKGTCFGYHNAFNGLKQALTDIGVELTHRSLYSLQVVHPMAFKPQDGKFNILYSMHEANRMPLEYAQKANEADLIIVPCIHNAQVFRDAGVFKEIRICPLGIDVSKWPYQEHEWKPPSPQDPFVFLFLGNAADRKDKRKGWDVFVYAMEEAFTPQDQIQCYLKFAPEKDEDQKLVTFYGKRLVVDKRNLPQSDLVKMYHYAHAFIYPSRGEGMGYTPMEAMLSGCLVLAPSIQGMVNYMTEHTGIPLPTQLWKNAGRFGVVIDIDNVDPKELAKLMRWIKFRYNSRVLRAKRKAGAKFIRDHFNWPSIATRLMDTIFNSQQRSVAHG